MNHLAIAERGTIFRAPNGSRLHGVFIPGQDDRDEMAVYVPPPEFMLGLDRMDHVMAKDFAEGERAKPGDLDLVMFSLHKFVGLAIKGNPSVVQMFWVPSELVIELGPMGEELLEMRRHLVARNALGAYRGYLMSQYHGLLGTRGKKVKRPELIEAYGYDCKYAMHAVRLGYQGLRLGRTGRVVSPVPAGEHEVLMGIRTGQWELPAVVSHIEFLLREIDAMIDNYRGPLPAEPDRALASKWLAGAHLRYWRGEQG